MLGIRLDSGDLAYLSVEARKLLDEAGFEEAKIVASNELDETIIHDLKRQDCQVAVWGVGTNLSTGGSQAALGGVYKLSAIASASGQWEYRLKLSERMTKVSTPGILQVRRYYSDKGAVADAIYDVPTGFEEGGKIIDPLDPTRHKKLPGHASHEDLLRPIIRQGKLVYHLPALRDVRQNTYDNLRKFHSGVKRFVYPHQYVVGMEEQLYHLKIDLVNNMRHAYRGATEAL